MSMAKIEYETTIFALKSDRLGPNQATLLHARTENRTGRFYQAILYLHGFIDYYFHDHVCERFLKHGYDFYALDLRKCGRSVISPEHDRYKHYCNDLSEYEEEITMAIEHIVKQTKITERKILLFGHSTGGLIATFYARSGSRRADIDGLILNSPFLAKVETTFVESALLKLLVKLRRSHDVDAGWYGRSIHASHRGEWDFDVTKKPIDRVRLHGPFLSAVRAVQNDLLERRIPIECPILFMCSNRSIRAGKTWQDEYAEADLVLNVTSMRRIAAIIGTQVTIYEIENAKHDIFLSKESVREKAFELMFRWLGHCEEDWTTKTRL